MAWVCRWRWSRWFDLFYLCLKRRCRCRWTKYYCSRCGKRILEPYNRNNGTKTLKKLCNTCYHEWHHVKVTCSVCGKEFEIKTGVLMARLRRSKSKEIICSIACRNKAKCKYDHLFRPVARDNANGMSVRRSFIKHGIPVGYQNILTKRMIKLGYKLRDRPVQVNVVKTWFFYSTLLNTLTVSACLKKKFQ